MRFFELTVAAAAVATATASPVEVRDSYAQFLKSAGRSLSSQEFEMRLPIYERNVFIMEQHNRDATKSYKMGVNQFTDMTHEEIKAMRMQPVKADALAVSCLSKGVSVDLDNLPEAPASFDWRNKNVVTPVKNQGGCGSCWAFSTVGALETAYALKYGASKLTQYSEQEIVDCSHGCAEEPPYGKVCNQGCGGGWPWSAYTDVMSWPGLGTETQYPYTGQTGTCTKTSAMNSAPISNYTCLSAQGPTQGPVDETKMAAFLATNGALSIALDASALSGYSSGIFTGPCSQERLDHAVLAVGYGTDNGQDYWLVKNSWGASWGEKGYFRIKRDSNECGMAAAVTFPLVK